MEVKIGVLHSSREILVDSDLSAQEIEAAVAASLASQSPLRLEDRKGSIVLVPGATIAYVEVGTQRRGGVGFGQL